MPDNKKHHYVPQFYLRFFSENGRSVNLFNLKQGKAIAQASLKGQCFRDYMYGKDQTLEHGLSRLEGAFAQLLRSSFASCRLPPPHSPDHESLLMLVALQYARSAYTADALDEMADGIWKRILRLRPDVDPTLLEKVKIVHTEPARRGVGLILRHYHLLLDLDYLLLEAPDDCEFVASDNPLVMYNQLMEFQDFGSATGLASRGLQIFFPLSPRFMVHLFDKDVYAVHPRGAAHMKIAQKADIDSLNTLQAVSAMENVYFKGPRADVYRVVELGAGFRRTRKARVFQAGNDSLDAKKSTLIGFSQVDIKTNLNLSFIRVLKPAKRWREALRSKRYRPTVVLRNPDFVKSHEQFLAAVDVGNYQPTEFRRFLRDSK